MYWNVSNKLQTDCGDPDHPVNGSVTIDHGTTFGQFAGYSCDNGYDLEGNKSRKCSEYGNWTGDLPSCKIRGWSLFAMSVL